MFLLSNISYCKKRWNYVCTLKKWRRSSNFASFAKVDDFNANDTQDLFSTFMKSMDLHFNPRLDFQKGNQKSTRFPFAVAVSGGPDSMAAVLLLQKWVHDNNINQPILGITIDHDLRPESENEANDVQKWLKQRGIHHVVLKCKWGQNSPNCVDYPTPSQLQIKARNSRYNLLKECCAQYKVKYLIAAHHLGDQLETMLLRLGRGSGFDGLSGMESITALSNHTLLLRPLLGVTKQSLINVCTYHGQEYICDPSNVNEQFDRVRVRKAIELMTQPSTFNDLPTISTQQLSNFISHMKEIRNELCNAESEILHRYALHGTLKNQYIFDLRAFDDPLFTYEIGIRVLTSIIKRVGQTSHPPRLASVKRLMDQLGRGTNQFKRCSIGNCLVGPVHQRPGLITIECENLSPRVTSSFS